MKINLEHDTILDTWNEDFLNGDYYVTLANGDTLGYNQFSEQFDHEHRLIEKKEAFQLIKKWGIDND